ncbi:MAG: stage V sporulation protein B [Clostridia bacterium]|nr:stage V sporulation protein B [Clostridia bacterium]
MARTSFVYGAAILVAASLFNRIVGFTYQILIIDLIGAKGIGLVNMVLPMYILAVVLATLGIPLAVSKFVAGELARGDLSRVSIIFRTSLMFLTASGLLISMVLYWGTPFLMDHIFINPLVEKAFLALIPGVFIVSVCSAFRGLFQGLLHMTPTALSQVIEQTVRVTTALALASYLLPRGIEYAAVGVSTGLILGELAGLIAMIIIFLRHQRQHPLPQVTFSLPRGIDLLRSMFSVSVPVTLSRIVATILLSLEASIIPKRLLVAGYTMEQATIIYGQLTGMAINIMVLPGIVTNALATTLVPAISEAVAQQNQSILRSRIIEALRLTLLVALPSFVTFFLLPSQITGLLFHNPEAGVLLQVLSFGGVFYYLQQTTNSILVGHGLAKIPLRNLVIASLLEIIGLFYLTGSPALGIKGAAYAVNISFFVVAILNLAAVLKLIGWKLEIRNLLLMPMLSAGVMAVVMHYSYQYIFYLSKSNLLATVTSLNASFITYFIALFFTGAIGYQDIRRIPGVGGRIISLLQKIFK